MRPAGPPRGPSAARASATASPTATPTAIAAAVTTAVSPSVTAAAKILDGPVVTAAGWIVLRGIVMRREVLGRGSVGIRLAFLCCFGVLVFHGRGLNRVVMFLEMFAFSGVRFIVGSMLLIHRMDFVEMELFMVHFLVIIAGTGQRFTGKHFDRRTIRGGQRGHGCWRLLVRMPG